jgi:hypothetical protein
MDKALEKLHDGIKWNQIGSVGEGMSFDMWQLPITNDVYKELESLDHIGAQMWKCILATWQIMYSSPEGGIVKTLGIIELFRII